jgi:hypothetical protein
MKWITRERPKIDRIACPWLIARFLDKDAEFLYVPASQVVRLSEETGAIPYDIPGVELGHEGELCSFDAFLKKYVDRARRGHGPAGADAAVGRPVRAVAGAVACLHR